MGDLEFMENKIKGNNILRLIFVLAEMARKEAGNWHNGIKFHSAESDTHWLSSFSVVGCEGV